MKILLPKEYYSKIMRAIIEFDLIDNDDRILIGLSGGKDSLFLTYALAFLKQHLRFLNHRLIFHSHFLLFQYL